MIRERFNAGVVCKSRFLKLDTVIEQKATELARFLVGRSREVDFTEPMPNLDRADNLNVQRRILSLTQEDATRLGVGRSTLHYLRKHAQEERSFRINRKVTQKIEVANL